MSGDMIYTTLGELKDLDLRTDDLQTDAKGRIALGLVPGLRYTYRPQLQRIDFEASDTRRVPNALANTPARPPTSLSGTGLVVNYEASVQINSPMQYGLYSEARFFYPGGVFSNTGTAYWYAEQHRYIRLDTSWTHSDTSSLITARIGNTISSSLSWTRPVRMGGAQLSRDSGLRPDLITYPVPTLAGSAVVPSAVDLYVNNVRQFSGSAPSGPFVINAVPAITGAASPIPSRSKPTQRRRAASTTAAWARIRARPGRRLQPVDCEQRGQRRLESGAALRLPQNAFDGFAAVGPTATAVPQAPATGGSGMQVRRAGNGTRPRCRSICRRRRQAPITAISRPPKARSCRARPTA